MGAGKYIAGGLAGVMLLAPGMVKDVAKAAYNSFISSTPAATQPIAQSDLESRAKNAPGNIASKSLADYLPSGEAQAGINRISIEDYYNSCESMGQILPNAKKGPYKVAITGMHNAFLNGSFNDLYFNNSSEGDEIKQILKDDPLIDFKLFDLFYQENGKSIKNVVVHGEGYLRLDPYDKKYKIVIPISKNTVNKFRKIPGIK